MYYTDHQIIALAALAAADYASACKGPTIRGLNGEKNLRGKSIEEVAANNGISIEEAQALTIDLATATFDEMSEHWKSVNIDSANGMIQLMESMGGEDVILAIDLEDEEQRLYYGDKLHQLWLEQPANSWAKGGDLDRPFSELPKEEQDKDIQQIHSLQKWLRAMQA